MSWLKRAMEDNAAIMIEAGVDKEVKQLAKKLKKAGWTIDWGHNHPKIYCSCGEHKHSLPGSPGGGRWLKNLIAELRRICPQAGI